ncbi:FAD-dependent oxidoreductase domain-containing protein 1-like [Oppia nitens]|uniref:FAD-dependent oxidoreductase domain-containing protein 1-like n=1 Tax=Oppia nitens TaxID=1686743 RepID=UPI0023DCC91D|nr:FAD-dependent oxidoreductase domain-containing protein 1-like [Oppia nitens]
MTVWGYISQIPPTGAICLVVGTSDLQLYRRYHFGNSINKTFKENLVLKHCNQINAKTYHKSNSSDLVNDFTDIVVIGGGIIGSSVAYWLKHTFGNQITCNVIERDPTYKYCSTTLSAGGIRQQFSLSENIQLSLFSSEFLQNIHKYLTVPNKDLPDINLKLNGYLLLATDSGAQQLIQNHKLQRDLGADIELLSIKQLKNKFPWISTDGVALASFGKHNEGWFDPWSLLMAFKYKAQSLGVNYLNLDVIGANISNSDQIDSNGSRVQTCNQLIVRQSDGNVKQLSFGSAIVCCGAFSAQIAKYLGFGSHNSGIRAVQLPIEPRKRFVYVINCKTGPKPDSPLLFDTSMTYFRPEGNGGNYICGRSPHENDEPDVDNLCVDHSFFESNIWTFLAQRVKAFESLKVTNSWSGFYEFNTLDQNAVIGRDPYYSNIYWCAGFSGHGLQMAPAVGRAITELIENNKYKTIDLTKFGWTRIINNTPIKETNIC